ncbi:MAG: hypothetical protein HY314_01735 [Acidobacteria bacterium]|nr:hypothetical protein [Acidobacteriota bacterium]
MRIGSQSPGTSGLNNQKLGALLIGLLLIIVTSPSAAETAPLPLFQIKYWAYQIQALEEPGAVDRFAHSRYDMLVLEYGQNQDSRPYWDDPNGYDLTGVLCLA